MYPELLAIARQRLSGERFSASATESIVHECYLRLSRGGQPVVESREHFFAIVSRLMRQILVDHARARLAQRRDKRLEVPLDEAAQVPDRAPFLLRMDEALHALAEQAPEAARLVELRFFGGLTAEESAGLLGREVGEVRRDLRFAQSWLKRALSAAGDP